MDQDELIDDLLFYGALIGAGAAVSVAAYFLLRRYFVVGKVEFNGRRWNLTDEDKLWAGRMIVGETGGNDRQSAAAVLWALVTRWLTASGGRYQSWSFTELLRAFSQPINPAWASADSPRCVENASACTPAQLERRAQIAGTSWGNLPATTRDVVDAFAQGRVDNPIPGYNNFAAANFIGSAALQSSELPATTIGGNTFVRDRGSLTGDLRVV